VKTCGRAFETYHNQRPILLGPSRGRAPLCFPVESARWQVLMPAVTPQRGTPATAKTPSDNCHEHCCKRLILIYRFAARAIQQQKVQRSVAVSMRRCAGGGGLNIDEAIVTQIHKSATFDLREKNECHQPLFGPMPFLKVHLGSRVISFIRSIHLYGGGAATFLVVSVMVVGGVACEGVQNGTDRDSRR
jgi:hypothetical protein